MYMNLNCVSRLYIVIIYTIVKKLQRLSYLFLIVKYFLVDLIALISPLILKDFKR